MQLFTAAQTTMTTCLLLLFLESIIISASDSPLGIDDLRFYNHGSVDSSDKFKLVGLNNNGNYEEGYMYQNDPLNSNSIHVSGLNWLFKTEPDGKTYSTPPSGMRSSVPFGSMGGGIFEMRGDGRFTDSLMYNNGPGAWPNNNWRKMDIPEMMFAVSPIDVDGGRKYPKILRTQLETNLELVANLQDFAIDNLQYEGAYPSARLSGYDAEWESNLNFHINLTAFGTFEPHNMNMSTTPGVIFVMDLISDVEEELFVDLLFTFPDQSMGFDGLKTLDMNGWTINKAGPVSDVTVGNISMSAYNCASLTECDKLQSDAVVSGSLDAMWSLFTHGNDSNTDTKAGATNKTQYSLISRNIKVPGGKGGVTSIVYSFSYYFPYRSWDNYYIGQYYSNLYKDSEDVNNFTISHLSDIVSNTKNWHNLMYNNSYPNYLKDFYVNSPSYLVRTSMYTVDGRWRQLETFDCDQIEPPHVGFFRKLPYQLFFTELDQNIISTLYIDHMVMSNGIFGEQGLVSENFGGSCGNPGILHKLDTPSGGVHSEDNPVFILDIYMNWKWATNGDAFMQQSYIPAKKAMYWSMNNAIRSGYSLPYRQVNTFDEHGCIGDLNSYNAIAYIVSLYAMKEMSTAMKDNNMTQILANEITNAKGNYTKYLWNDKNGNFISFWCANGIYSPNTLQGDSLYGLVWKFVLDIDIEMDTDDLVTKFISHLQKENEWSFTPNEPYGVVFNVNMTNHTYHCSYGSSHAGAFRDEDKWEDFTLNSGSLYVYLLNDTKTGMKYYETILQKYAALYNDQWDYRILSHYFAPQNDTNKPLIGIDLNGGDAFNSPRTLSKPDYNLCWNMCNQTQGCQAWTYQPPHTASGCSQYTNADPLCWLKSTVPSEGANPCVTSGIEPNTEPQISPSRPSCTSHYDRQLIGYSFILALNGQKYDARNGRNMLKLAPKRDIFNTIGDCVPVLIPNASSLLCKIDEDNKCYKIHTMFGKLRLTELQIYDRKIEWNDNQKSLNLMQNQYEIVCHSS